jgi:hypothetical protein
LSNPAAGEAGAAGFQHFDDDRGDRGSAGGADGRYEVKDRGRFPANILADYNAAIGDDRAVSYSNSKVVARQSLTQLT